MPTPAQPVPTQPIRLHRHALSGHSHRVELALSMLRLPYELVDVDLKQGAHKRPEFLAMNPFGQVPVIQDGAVTLYDSNAILTYLALTYDAGGTWLPRDPLGAAQVQQWFSLAAGQIAAGPATARLANVFAGKVDHARAVGVADALLQRLDGLLTGRAFALGATPTLADLAGYSYVAHAPEGGVSLEPHPHVRDWLARIEALPGFVPFRQTAVGLRAVA